MAWKQIVKESDDSLIRVYQHFNQHMTVSFFNASELSPIARHEDIVDPPSDQHEWDGSVWTVDLEEYKQNALDNVKVFAKIKLDDFDNALIKQDFITILIPFKSDFQNAVDTVAIDIIKTNALAAIKAL